VVTEYVPDANPSKVVPAWNVVPSILYASPAPVGEVIVIDPNGMEHVGCVTATVATAGATGAAFIVTGAEVEVQPPAF
jgi:hypothetical protein